MPQSVKEAKGYARGFRSTRRSSPARYAAPRPTCPSQVRARVVPDVSCRTLQNHVHTYVELRTRLYTDNNAAYHALASEYEHAIIDHMLKYVNGRVHTNGIENDCVCGLLYQYDR